MTTAQTTRLVHIHHEATAAGTRVTTRKLRGGLIRITEYVKGGGKASLVMGLDGLYL